MGGLWPDGSVANRIQVTKGGFVLILFVVIASVITKRLLIGQNYRQILYAQPINRRIAMKNKTIEKQTATVWYAPTRGRRYLSRSGAIKGEAYALIIKKHPPEPPDYDTGYPGYHIKYQDPDRFEKMHRRMCKLIRKSLIEEGEENDG